MAVRTAYDPTAGEILTATNLEKLAGGWIGYNQVTASQGSITADVDLTGLSVAVTVGPSRRIRISAYVAVETTVASDRAALLVKEGATQLTVATVSLLTAARGVSLTASVVLTPTTGAHTYKLSMVRTDGSGTLTSIASATQPAFILCEDIGPAA